MTPYFDGTLAGILALAVFALYLLARAGRHERRGFRTEAWDHGICRRTMEWRGPRDANGWAAWVLRVRDDGHGTAVEVTIYEQVEGYAYVPTDVTMDLEQAGEVAEYIAELLREPHIEED